MDFLFEYSVCQFLHCGKVFCFHAGADGDHGGNDVEVFHLEEHVAHDFSCGGCPRTVFEDADAAVLVVLNEQLMEKFVHGREESGVVRGGADDEFAHAEGVFYGLCHIIA